MIAHVGEKCLGQSCLEGGRKSGVYPIQRGKHHDFLVFIWTI